MFYEDDLNTKRLKAVSEAKTLYEEQRHIFNNAKRLMELTLDDYTRSVRAFRTDYDYAFGSIEAAMSEFRITDKRRKKENLGWLNKKLREDFGLPDDVTIKDCTWMGFERYSISLMFDLCGKECVIRIPFKDRLPRITQTDSLYEIFRYGAFEFMEKNGACTTVLKYSVNPEVIKDYIAGWMKAETNDGN